MLIVKRLKSKALHEKVAEKEHQQELIHVGSRLCVFHLQHGQDMLHALKTWIMTRSMKRLEKEDNGHLQLHLR